MNNTQLEKLCEQAAQSEENRRSKRLHDRSYDIQVASRLSECMKSILILPKLASAVSDGLPLCWLQITNKRHEDLLKFYANDSSEEVKIGINTQANEPYKSLKFKLNVDRKKQQAYFELESNTWGSKELGVSYLSSQYVAEPSEAENTLLITPQSVGPLTCMTMMDEEYDDVEGCSWLVDKGKIKRYLDATTLNEVLYEALQERCRE